MSLTIDGQDELVYEPPVVIASFPKGELVADLPENIEAHMHAVESS